MSRLCPTPFLSLMILSALALTGIPHTARAQRAPEDQITRDLIEKELSYWKPTRENNATPKPDCRYVLKDPSGIWQGGTSLESTRIKLFPMPSGRYRVLFSTSGCLESWTLERTATYRDGILLLDHPVKEYSSLAYNRLFTIHTPKGIGLISDRALHLSQTEHAPLPIESWVFTNAAPSAQAGVPLPRSSDPEQPTHRKESADPRKAVI